MIEKERREPERREKLYRGRQPAPDLRGQVVFIVDDGLATGSTMLVAARYVRALRPAKVIIAVPIASIDACERVKEEGDDLVCLATRELFMAVGERFRDFRQVSDAEVQRVLQESRLQLHQDR